MHYTAKAIRRKMTDLSFSLAVNGDYTLGPYREAS